MKKIYFLFFLLAIGCGVPNRTNDEVLVIPVKFNGNQILPFSESGLQFRYELLPIYMDTTHLNSFLTHPIMKIYKDYFYFYTTPQSSFKIFGMDGKFIREIPVGRGPGELSFMIHELFFHEDTFTIAELDKQLTFDLEGKFLHSEKTEIQHNADICQFGNYRLSYLANTLDSGFVKVVNTNSGITLMHVVAKKSDSDGVKQLPVNGNMVKFIQSQTSSNRFVLCNENLYFRVPMSDCIYRINKGDSIPYVYAKIENLFTSNEINMEQGKEALNKNLIWDVNYLGVRDDGNLISFQMTDKAPEIREEKKREHVIYDKTKNQLYQFPIQNLYGGYNKGDDTYYYLSSSFLTLKTDNYNELEKEIINSIGQENEEIQAYVLKIKITR